MSEPTLQDCINYMRSQIKQMEKYPRNYEFNLPYYRKTVELLEKTDRPQGKWEYLKEHITEMRDANGKLSQKQTCQFILELMGVIEREGEAE